MTSIRNSLSVAVVGAAAVACAVDLVPLGPAGQLALPTELENRPVFRPPPVRGEGFVLIDGVRKLTIVTPRKNPSGLWALGGELKNHLEEMSGQTVDLVEPKNRPVSGPVVVIGTDDGEVPQATSIVRWDGKDELYIGGEGAGVSHALTYVLEALGCRYLFPGKAGKVIPRKSRVVLPKIELEHTPVCRLRKVRLPSVSNVREDLLALGIDPDAFATAKSEASQDNPSNRSFWVWHGVNDWKTVGTVNPPFEEIVTAGHHFGEYWTTYGEEHPDWFALQGDDTRTQTNSRPRLCTSNRELRMNIVDECLGRFEKTPKMQGISICMQDGGYVSACLCEDCRRLDPPNAPPVSMTLYRPTRRTVSYVSLADRMLDFSNFVMREVRARLPGKNLCVYAYSNYVSPPVLNRPDPDLIIFNVYGGYTTEKNREGLRRNLAGWLSFGNPVVWRPNCLAGFECPYPMNFGRLVFNDLEALKANGVIGVDFDCGNAEYASRGFMFYMLAKAIHNPDRLDYDTIAADWLACGFGAAAGPVGDYLKALERTFDAATRRGIGVRGYQEAFDADALASLLDAADAAAGGDGEVRARIAYLRVGLGRARAARKVYDAWATGRKNTLNAAREEYRAWIAEDAMSHPFEFPHSCPHMTSDAYNLSDDGVLLDITRTNDLVLVDDRTVFVPAGVTNFYENLDGADFTLTKTGGGVLQVGRVASPDVSVVVEDGVFEVVNRRPSAFADAFFHVDASAADTLVTELRNGTNFVTRWNDVDGRAGRFAGPLDATYHGRTDPTDRLPFVTEDRQGGRPFVDFGTLAVPGYTNVAGTAIGWGGALAWSEPCTAMREGFTVVSDTPDIDSLVGLYAGATAYPAMSFFSNLSGMTGYRGSLSASHRPYFYQDASGNDAFTDGTTELNGLFVNWKSGFPRGFQLVNARTTGPARVETFGAEYRYASKAAARVFGGTRIAEQCVFTNVLSQTAHDEITRYLRAKWFPATLKSLTVRAGARFAVDADSALTVAETRYVDKFGVVWPEPPGEEGDALTLTGDWTVGVVAGKTVVCRDFSGGAYTLTKTGSGVLELNRIVGAKAKLVVAEGELGVNLVNPRPDGPFAKAYFHVDAADVSSMTVETENGTNFVTRWNDADGRADRYATPCLTVWNCRTDPAKRRPFLTPAAQNGLPAVNFGSLLTKYNTNEVGRALGYGAAMDFDRTSPDVAEAFVIASDGDDALDWASVPGIGWGSMHGMSYLSHETAFRCVRRAYTSKTSACGILHDSSNNYSFRYGQVWLDGTLLTGHPKFTSPSMGFHLLRFVPDVSRGATSLNSFGAEMISSKNGGDRSYGGTKIAEYAIFTNALDDAEATAVDRYLQAKWFPQRLTSLRMADGTRCSFGQIGRTAAISALQVDTLEVGTVPGSLTVRIRDPEPLYGKTFRLIGFKAVNGSLDGWTVVADCNVDVRLKLRSGADGVYVTVGESGFMMMLK